MNETIMLVLDDYLAILEKHHEGFFFDLLHDFKNDSFFAGDFGVQVLQTNFVVSVKIAEQMGGAKEESKDVLKTILENAKTDSEQLFLMRNLILANVDYESIKKSLNNNSVDMEVVGSEVAQFLNSYNLARN